MLLLNLSRKAPDNRRREGKKKNNKQTGGKGRGVSGAWAE